jgi:predicted nucleic acid-binding protein
MNFMSDDTRVFFDTNILVYCEDASAPIKQQTAQSLTLEALQQGSGVISAQVMSDYFVTVTRKIAHPLSDDAAAARLRAYTAFRVESLNAQTVLTAVLLKTRHQISYWDAMILASAAQAGCTTVLSEDLKHGEQYSGVTVRNPFV